MTEDEMVGWHHRLNGDEFGDGQGSLACCSPWVTKSWTIKKAERHSFDAFELWWWGQPFESPLACKEIKPVNPKGNQS